MSFMINNLAVKFCEVLHEWLTRDELRQCANVDAHVYLDDFCDPNMAMDKAWNRMFQDEFDVSSDVDIDLWNAAWNLAYKHNFNTNK